MKKMKAVLFGVVALAGLMLVGPRAAYAERSLKVHPSIQPVLTSTYYTGAISSTSATMDMSGGDMEKVSCMVAITSGTSTGTPTFDIAIQSSPDGTAWVTVYSFTQITSTTTVTTANPYIVTALDKPTGIATKTRLLFTGAANTVWNGVRAWCLPNQE